jgi:hypothetical protein
MRCNLSDIKKVSRVLIDKSVYPFTVEDGPKVFPIWDVLDKEQNIFLMPNKDTVAIFLWVACGIYDFHFNALPNARGMIAKTSAKKVIEYVNFNKLFSIVPVVYEWAVNFYRKIGMAERGLSKNKFLKYGKLYNQIIFVRGK